MPRLALRAAVGTAALAVSLPLGAQAAAAPYDVVITNARIIDGTGNPWFRGDLAVRAGRIAAIGRVNATGARRVIDARDRVVTPGFIDLMGTGSTPLLSEPSAAGSRIFQGITTALVGEGGSEAPQNDQTLGEGLLVNGRRVKWKTFAEYFALLERQGVPFNLVHDVGAAQVRQVVMGVEDRRPTADEMARMKAMVEQAMKDGAVGISTALIYPPGTYATTEELIDLSKSAAKYGGVYFSHMRNESSKLLDAINEVIRIGEEARIPVHVYHLKAAGEENWPLMAKALTLIADARARGVEITADIYPYIRNGIGLGSFLHPRHYAQGDAPFLATLGDPATRRALRQEVETTSDWENWYRHVGKNWDNVLITGVGDGMDKSVVGLSVRGVAQKRGVDEWDAFFDLVKSGPVDVAPQSMNEDQKHQALRAPFVAIDVDSPLADPKTAPSAHPRAFGAMPRVIAKYVRQDSALTLVDAVRRMTSLPANILRLHDRGRISVGMRADLLLFDPEKIQDNATYEKPLQYASGIDYMFVNGTAVIADGKLTGARPGTVIRHR